jgi:carbonic anhydrase
MNDMQTFYNQLLENNKKWVAKKIDENPDFFSKLATGQKPPVLWIGCADSRVPANEIIGAMPGEVFVHRNVANMVIHTDMNMLSCLDYAVSILGVQHVIVCGHYNCGGVMAAMTDKQYGLVDNWIDHIKDVYRFNKIELDGISDLEARARRFVELNVIEQVRDLQKTAVVKAAWRNAKTPSLHGWVYDVANGLIKELITVENTNV